MIAGSNFFTNSMMTLAVRCMLVDQLYDEGGGGETLQMNNLD